MHTKGHGSRPSYKPRGRWKGSGGKGGVRYRPCHDCAPNVYNTVEFLFNSGSSQPTTANTLTAPDSSATGVVDKVYLYKGSWAAGNAEGVVRMKSATGVTGDTAGQTWGSDSETINSTISDNIMTMDGVGMQKTYGVLYPESPMGEFEGDWYCQWHLRARRKQDAIDKAELDLDESYRYED